MTNHGETSADRADDDHEGPFLRATYRNLDRVDNNEDPRERRRGWLRAIPAFLAALAEDYLRELAAFAALLACVIAVIASFDLEQGGLTAAVIIGAVVGAAVVLVTAAKPIRVGHKWLIYVGILATQVGLIIAIQHMTG